MRKIILCLVLLSCSVNALSQPVGQDSTNSRAHSQLIKGMNTYNSIATAAGMAGGALVVLGGLLWMSQFRDGLPGGTGYDEGTSKTGEVLFYTGAGLIVASFLVREPYKRQSRIVQSLSALPSIEMKTALQPQGPNLVKRLYPSMTFRFEL